MCASNCIRVRIFFVIAAVVSLAAAWPIPVQAAQPLRYVFGTNSFTDSKGQKWSPVPTSALAGSADWHWSSCSKSEAFTGTADPGLYREQISEDTGDLVLKVPLPRGSYTVKLYFAEPCSNFKAGQRVFGIVINGATIVPRLDLVASAGVGKPVIESASILGTEVLLDLKRITQQPMIAAIEILPATSAFQLQAKITWDDGTPVAGAVVVAQQTSANPVVTTPLGKFTINASGVATATVSPQLNPPLTFTFTLVNPSGVNVNTFTFTCDPVTFDLFPHTLNATIVLNKSSATLKSFSF
jgi:hypothetical protein